MSAGYYRPLVGLAASLSLALTGCGLELKREAPRPADPVAVAPPARTAQPAAVETAAQRDPLKTDATIWTLLGFTKRESLDAPGPRTGPAVSPELWQATKDTLHFAGVGSEDPMTGLYRTDWYSPQGQPAERLRVSVFILARALRSDSVTVTVERQVRSPEGQWQQTPVAQDVVTALDSAILSRARQIHAERYRETTYN